MCMSQTYQGVNATQLVFTPRIHRADHMRIKRAAAVYLDTWPFNGHSTSVEALCVLFFFLFFSLICGRLSDPPPLCRGTVRAVFFFFQYFFSWNVAVYQTLHLCWGLCVLLAFCVLPLHFACLCAVYANTMCMYIRVCLLFMCCVCKYDMYIHTRMQTA